MYLPIIFFCVSVFLLILAAINKIVLKYCDAVEQNLIRIRILAFVIKIISKVLNQKHQKAEDYFGCHLL